MKKKILSRVIKKIPNILSKYSSGELDAMIAIQLWEYQKKYINSGVWKCVQIVTNRVIEEILMESGYKRQKSGVFYTIFIQDNGCDIAVDNDSCFYDNLIEADLNKNEKIVLSHLFEIYCVPKCSVLELTRKYPDKNWTSFKIKKIRESAFDKIRGVYNAL